MAKNYITTFRGEQFYTPNGKFKIKDEPITPIEEDFGDHNRLAERFEAEYNFMKKSLSQSDITALQEDFLTLDLHSNKEEIFERYRKNAETPQAISKTKYVSMAEAVYHYQRDTPGRFHSVRPQTFNHHASGPRGLTVPQSPNLRCKMRSRPVHILSQKEKEEMEVEEIKNFKIKANPVPKSVIEGTKNLPEVPKKPPTVPEPFHLTEVQKKVVLNNDQFQFKARPAPKHILDKPHVPPKPPVQITKPISPKFHYKRSTENLKCDYKLATSEKSAEKPKHVQRLGPIHPIPFSFEKRDEEMKRRREEKIKQQIEEERKQASQFKAQPLPGAVRKQMCRSSGKGCSSTTSSENKENVVKFEARPPVVLYKKPFRPVLQATHILKSAPFALTTEKRASEREKFDKLLREKEEEQEKLRKQRELEQLEAEDKAKVELRAKLVHHAKPVPDMRPFIPEKTVGSLTVPETPKFVRRLKQSQH